MLARTARHPRQRHHVAGLLALGGVLAEVAAVLPGLHGGEHGAVERVHHGGRTAARVITTEQGARETLHHKSLRGLEHLGLGAAKAVDGLFGIAHQKHARRFARAGAGIGREPAVQRLPLQRVGVLEFVDQQVAHACIQPLLQPAREFSVAQQAARGGLHVVHVDPAALVLEGGKAGEQHACEAGHALVVQPGLVLGAGSQHAHGHVLRSTHLLDAGELVAELARLALLREQCVDHPRAIQAGERLLQFDALGRKRHRAGAAKGCGGTRQEAAGGRVAHQPLERIVEARELGKLLGHRIHRGLHHTGRIGQHELHAFLQRFAQGLLRLKTAMCSNGIHKVLAVGRTGG